MLCTWAKQRKVTKSAVWTHPSPAKHMCALWFSEHVNISCEQHPQTVLLKSRNYPLFTRNTRATYLFQHIQSPDYNQRNYKTNSSHIPSATHAWILRGKSPGHGCYSQCPCNREGFAILFVHSSARINNSCEVWTQQRIKPVTSSYSMIFLIIRSLCWTASNFQSTQQGSQVSEMRASRSERCEVLNVNVNYEELFQYFSTSWQFSNFNPSDSPSFC